MKNEKILIFGDSYSTYQGYVPEGNAVYYPKSGEGMVDDVSKTWWNMLANETESVIVLNDSWSGSTICNTGYDGDCSKTSSFICRLNKLIESGFFAQNELDRVFVFGATNDSWTDNACGEILLENWTDEDLRLVLPGISFFISKLAAVVSSEKIHFIINSELRNEITSGIKAICEHFNIKYTELSNVEKIEGHPTHKGMTAIKSQILLKV